MHESTGFELRGRNHSILRIVIVPDTVRGMQAMTGTAAEVFRANVRIVMKDRDITITKLAEDSGTSRPGLSRILSGKDGATLERADRIAHALGLPLRELLSENLEKLLVSA